MPVFLLHLGHWVSQVFTAFGLRNDFHFQKMYFHSGEMFIGITSDFFELSFVSWIINTCFKKKDSKKQDIKLPPCVELTLKWIDPKEGGGIVEKLVNYLWLRWQLKWSIKSVKLFLKSQWLFYRNGRANSTIHKEFQGDPNSQMVFKWERKDPKNWNRCSNKNCTGMFKAALFIITKQCNGEGDGTPLQYSCLENPTDGGAW